MEKSTVSALIVAGAGMLTAIFQVLVMRAVKRKREAEDGTLEERMRKIDPTFTEDLTDED